MAFVGLRGQDVLQKKFQRLAQRLSGPERKVMFEEIGARLEREVNNNFKSQAFEDKPWEPLKPATLERRIKGPGAKESSGNILEDEGILRASINSDPTKDFVKVGSPVKYAPTHEDGRGAIPQRKFLPSKEKGLGVAVKVAKDYVKGAIRKSGLS